MTDSIAQPKRIQRRRTKGWRMPPGAVYVGRPTVLADRVDVSELRGRDLACWCPLDAPCHADLLIELANSGGA